MMTPPEFSTPLISAGADPGAVYNEMKKAWREWQVRRIHDRVVKEIEDFERRRSAAGENID